LATFFTQYSVNEKLKAAGNPLKLPRVHFLGEKKIQRIVVNVHVFNVLRVDPKAFQQISIGDRTITAIRKQKIETQFEQSI